MVMFFSPPLSIAPRQIPPARLRKFFRHRIIAMRPTRTAAPEPRQPHPAARPETEYPDRVAGEFRAGRQVPARPPGKGRERVAIERDEENGGDLEWKIHDPPEQRHDSIHQPRAARA